MVSRKHVPLWLAVVVAAIVPMTGQTAADPAHVKEVIAWRASHEADYRRDYVPLAGLSFLKPGANSVGSAAGSDVLLPARLPASVGRFTLENSRIRFEPAPRLAEARSGQAPVSAMLNGKPVVEALTLAGIPPRGRLMLMPPAVPAELANLFHKELD